MFRINKCMKLDEIRDKVAKNEYDRKTLRQELLDWLSGRDGKLHLDTGLSIMPSKVLWKQRNGKQVYRHLNLAELERANVRFVQLLNKVVYKEGYKRFNKRLDVVAVIEGKREYIDIHTHLAIRRPVEVQTNEFARRVLKALQLSGEFEIINKNYNAEKDCVTDKYRYNLEIIDCGWQSYITKKLNGKDFDNLYLP